MTEAEIPQNEYRVLETIMQLSLIFALVFAQVFVHTSAQTSNTALLAARMHCLELLTLRATSYSQLQVAYANCTSDDVTHTVRDVGDFGPSQALSREYDEVVNIFPLLDIPSPVILRPVFDPSTLTWLDDDMARVDYIINITLQYNYTSGGYDYVMQGFRYSTFFVFANSTTDRVSLIYDIQDPAAIALFSSGSNGIPAEVICSQFIFPACNGTPSYLADTGYSTVAECTEFIASVQAPSVCQLQGRSNTAACRVTHSWVAFIRPDIHCSHVSRDNPVCHDNCFPACDNCDVNAECVASFPTLFDTGYKCQCKNGYTGDGHTCAPSPCNGGGRCGENYQACVDGVCKCVDTFTWDSSTGECTCEGGAVWNGVCVPTGRCTKKKHCTAQLPNTVSCSEYGFNPLTQWKHCLCNYGYEGGWEYPCTCTGINREVSTGGSGKVCIAPGECTRDGHCGSGHSCVLRGDGTGVGDCN